MYVSITRNVHWTACVRRTQLAARKSPLVRSEGRQHLCQCGEEAHGESIRGRDATICVGLAIVAQVIARHAGTIAAEESDDGGAMMRVTLPGTPSVDDGVDS